MNFRSWFSTVMTFERCFLYASEDRCSHLYFSSKFVRRYSFSGLIPLSTNPVDVCIYGVPYITLMFRDLLFSLNSFPVKEVPLSVLIVCGRPFIVTYCSKFFFAVLFVGASELQAAAHLLYRSIESSL